MIKQKQLENAIEEIIVALLENGNIPTFNKVSSILNKKLKREPGLPNFVPKYIEPYSVSSAEDTNKMFADIYNDLSIAFKDMRYQNERLLAMVNAYNVEHSKTLSIMKKNEERFKALKTYTLNNVLPTDKIINNIFNNFLEVDFNGDDANYIPQTNCMVDLKQQKVYTWRHRTRVNILDSTIEDKSYDDNRVVSALTNSLTDTISEKWETSIFSKNTTAKHDILIEPINPITANSIVLTTIDTSNLSVDLYLSEDNKTYIKQSDSILKNNMIEWNFNEQKITSIKFQLKKSEPDGFIGTDNIFILGIKNISVYRNSYKNEGVFVSSDYTITNATALVLDTLELIYPNTAIRYYIVFNNGNSMEWKEIVPIKNNNISQYKSKIPDFLLDKNQYTGKIKLVAKFETEDISPQLLRYNIIPIVGDQYDT